MYDSVRAGATVQLYENVVAIAPMDENALHVVEQRMTLSELRGELFLKDVAVGVVHKVFPRFKELKFVGAGHGSRRGHPAGMTVSVLARQGGQAAGNVRHRKRGL